MCIRDSYKIARGWRARLPKAVALTIKTSDPAIAFAQSVQPLLQALYSVVVASVVVASVKVASVVVASVKVASPVPSQPATVQRLAVFRRTGKHESPTDAVECWVVG